MRSAAARAHALAVARRQHGVVGRRQLLRDGVPRWFLQAEVRVGRWQRTGRQTLAVHSGPLDAGARRLVALLEAGPRAALDGVSSLQEAGLDVLRDDVVHVIVPKGVRRVVVPGARVHESRRFREADVVGTSVRRTRPATAAVHAALWARTDREATYVLVLAVQQGLVTPSALADEVATVLRHRRRRLLRAVALDVTGGVRSLGELDVATGLRRRGLPEPARQVVRTRPSGTQYLDAEWPRYGVVLEVDGVQHDLPAARLADLLRDLALAGEERTVVRVPLVVWRLDQEVVLDGLEELLRRRGWVPRAA